MGNYYLAIDPSYKNFEVSLFKENKLIEQHYFRFNSKKMEEINTFLSIFLKKYQKMKPFVTIENRIPYLNNKEKEVRNIYSQMKLERLRWLIIGILTEQKISYELTYTQTWRKFFEANFPIEVTKFLEFNHGKNKFVWTKTTSYQLALLFKEKNNWKPIIKKDGESTLIGYYKAIKSNYE